MSFGTLAASIIRTVVPILLGGFISWLATMGIQFDPATSEAIVNGTIILLSALVMAAYYVVVRIIEQRWPAFGVLLGLKKAPVAYSPEPDNAKAVIADSLAGGPARGAPDVSAVPQNVAASFADAPKHRGE